MQTETGRTRRPAATARNQNKKNAMSTISLQQNVIKEVASLFDNEEAMRKVLSFVRKMKRDSKAKSEELTPAEKKEVLDDLRDAFRELEQEKEGKVRLNTWEEFKHELHC